MEWTPRLGMTQEKQDTLTQLAKPTEKLGPQNLRTKRSEFNFCSAWILWGHCCCCRHNVLHLARMLGKTIAPRFCQLDSSKTIEVFLILVLTSAWSGWKFNKAGARSTIVAIVHLLSAVTSFWHLQWCLSAAWGARCTRSRWTCWRPGR